MRVQKTLLAGTLAGSLALSGGPAFALAWDWPYPSADPKPALQEVSVARPESHATRSDGRQLESASSQGRIDKNRSHTVRDKTALRGDRGAADRSEFNRDGSDR